MLTAVLVMYLIAGVLFALFSVSCHMHLYDMNDMLTKGAIVAYLVLGWPYYLLKAVRLNLKDC